MLALLAYLALQSIIFIHRIELPILSIEGRLCAYLFPGPDLQAESHRIERIRDALDNEFAKRKDYSTINTGKVKKAITASSVRTRRYTHIIVSVILGLFGSSLIVTTMRARNRLYEERKGPDAPWGRGTEGFIRLVREHVDPGMIELIRNSPTPHNLANAFRAARENVNIPCSTAARLFPRNAAERMAILEYGKERVRFAGYPEDAVSGTKGG
ncbi:MAG: hypothetical protein H6Q52_2496 [Deltaproteobacteria bacterium]|nr:hypothetical protein [Deltaproteobacteria bacterium]